MFLIKWYVFAMAVCAWKFYPMLLFWRIFLDNLLEPHCTLHQPDVRVVHLEELLLQLADQRYPPRVPKTQRMHIARHLQPFHLGLCVDDVNQHILDTHQHKTENKK